MFLGGYKAARHVVYFGEKPDKLSRKAVLTTSNIFSPGKLNPGKKYYWRVDAVGPDGKVTVGAVWRFEAAAVLRPS